MPFPTRTFQDYQGTIPAEWLNAVNTVCSGLGGNSVRYLASAGQTVFSIAGLFTTYTIAVYINGILQDSSDAYTISDEVLTLSEPAQEGDEIIVNYTTNSGTILNNAENISFTQVGIGAVPSTVQAKLQEYVSVKDFGAVGDGVTDDTVAIQSAIASANGAITGLRIHFPAGIYKISSTLDIGDKQNMYLFGDGSNATVIRPTAAVTSAIKFGDTGTAYQGIKDLHIECVNAPTCTALTVQYVNSFWLDGVTITSADIGILVNGGVIQYYTNFQVNVNKSCGIKIVGGNDHFFKHGVLSNVGSPEPTIAGIWCTKSDAFWLDSVDCITQKVGLYLAPQGTDYISWIFVSNSAFDSGTGDGIKFEPAAGALIKGSTFTGCWSSTNDFGVSIAGAGTVDGCRFVNHRAFNNGKSGYVISNSGTAKNIFFDSCDAAGNSASSVGTYSGFDIGAGVGQFSIANCRSGVQSNFINTQARGILINPGASDNYTLVNNDVRLNIGEGIYDGGTGATKHIANNLGARTHSRGYAEITTGASSVIVNHGLDFTPSQNDILVTPTGNMLAVGVQAFWVSAVSATTFTISVNAATSNVLAFSWDVRVKGA